MLSSSLFTMLKLSKMTSLNKLFDYDCVTLYLTSSELSTNTRFYKTSLWISRCYQNIDVSIGMEDIGF